jgi:hypothetical protein
MKVGDPIRITTEFGQYWHYTVEISGMVGILLRLNRAQAEVWLSNGQTCKINSPHVWLEAINESR